MTQLVEGIGEIKILDVVEARFFRTSIFPHPNKADVFSFGVIYRLTFNGFSFLGVIGTGQAIF